MVNESIKSFISGVYEKFTSPLAGAFISVWIVVNWRLVSYYLFGVDPMLTKIDYISEFYICEWNNLYKPIIITSAVVIVYPPLSVIAFWIWEYFHSVKTNMRLKISNNVLLPLAESKKIKADIRDLENKQFAETRGYEDKIKSLNEMLYERDNTLNDSSSHIEDLEKEIDSLRDILDESPNDSTGTSLKEKQGASDSENVEQETNWENFLDSENSNVDKSEDKFNPKKYLEDRAEFIESKIQQTKSGTYITLRKILGPQYEEVPRDLRKVVEDEFLQLVNNMYFTGLSKSSTSSGENLYSVKY